jgi:hypothetical protein
MPTVTASTFFASGRASLAHMTDLRGRKHRTAWLTEEDPRFHCAACADDEHRTHVNVFIDLFGEEHACTCPRCA